MINRNLKDNWRKIISFNSNVEILENPLESEESVRIPLTNIETKAYLLYNLFEIFYPRYITSQLNTLDLIVSDYDLDNITLNTFIYEMTKPGIFDNVKELPKDEIKLSQKKLDNKETLFNEIQSTILKLHKIRISSIRIFKKRGVDLINRHCENLTKYTTFETLTSLLNLIQTLINDQLVIIYPEPNIIKFSRYCSQIIKDFEFSNLFQSLLKLTEFSNINILLMSEDPFLLSFEKNNISNNSFGLDISLDFVNSTTEKNLDSICSELKLQSLLKIDLSSILALLDDIFESPIPLEQERFRLLFQKFLFGIRSYNVHWQLSPRPIIYNTLLRYLLRLFGINLNLKKLSHWSIPDFIFSIFNSYVGIKSKVLIIITESSEIRNAYICFFEKGVVSNVELYYFENLSIENIELLRKQVSIESGYISQIIKIDLQLVKKFLDVLVFNYSKLSLFGLLNLLNMAKKDRYLEISPNIPPFKLLKSKGSLSILKLLLGIFIDKYEF